MFSKNLKNLAFLSPNLSLTLDFCPQYLSYSPLHTQKRLFLSCSFIQKAFFTKCLGRSCTFSVSSRTVPQPHSLSLGIYFSLCKSHMFSFDEVIRIFCFQAPDPIFLRKFWSLCDLPEAEIRVLVGRSEVE